jgi:hypothetical protein
LLIAVLALLAAFALPAAAQAGATKSSAPGKNGVGKNCSKKRSGKKKCATPEVGAADSDCPRGATECHIDVELKQASPTSGAYCSSFEDGDGSCLGSTLGTSGWSSPGYFPQYGIQSWFTWTSQGPVRNVEYLVKANQLIVEAFIRGNVPSPGSASFNVTDAYNRVTDAHWQTVSTGGAPGTKGGPLYIDYEHKVIGSYVHIWGWMVRK